MTNFDPAGTFNDDYLWFYDESLSAERNRNETAEILQLLGSDGPLSVLDAPCGHGRISNLLASAGHAVVGVDIIEMFLDLAADDATDLGVQVDYRAGDLRAMPVETETFDAVVCWFTSIGYFDDDGNRAVLAEFARVLKPGGKLIIETLHHDGFVRHHKPAPIENQVSRGNDTMTDVVTFNSITGRTETDRTVQRDGQVRRSHFSVRLPTAPEFDEWLTEAGFAERSYHDRLGLPLTVDSMRIVVTAQK